MLNLLHRHVLREVLVATGLAMGLFVFVLLLGNAMRDIAELVAAGKLDAIVFLKLMGLFVILMVNRLSWLLGFSSFSLESLISSKLIIG